MGEKPGEDMDPPSPAIGENRMFSANGDMGEMSANADGDILDGVMPGERPGVARPGVIAPARELPDISCRSGMWLGLVTSKILT